VRDIERIVGQIASVNVRTVNLGGNEPIFTNGLSLKDTLLPHVVRSLYDAHVMVGLTTAGISLNHLERFYPESLSFLNDVDVSLDSPFFEEHNANRGALLFNHALKALRICNEYGINKTIVMCGMNWNLSNRHIDELVRLARKFRAFIRINFIKPTEPEHMEKVPDATTYYRATNRLLSQCHSVEIDEPLIAVAANLPHKKGCPCGSKSFRIHSITPDGTVPVSPCVFAHDYKVGDILVDELIDIVAFEQFRAFIDRCAKPSSIEGCQDCQHIETCRGGCASRAYLTEKFKTGKINLLVRDPYCIRDMEKNGSKKPTINSVEELSQQGLTLVHRDYLCTIIAKPK
jgi:radical SAM protein with 4Fe4S-binding SPASM domain